MPTFHVIYDPHDRIKVDPEMNKSLKIQVATLRVAEVPDDDPVFYADTVRDLAQLLLKNMTV